MLKAIQAKKQTHTVIGVYVYGPQFAKVTVDFLDLICFQLIPKH